MTIVVLDSGVEIADLQVEIDTQPNPMNLQEIVGAL